MARKRYRFNPQTLTYEVITLPFRIRFYRLLRKILIAFILATLVNMLFSYFFYTPKMYRLSQYRNELLLKYSVLNDKISDATATLDAIYHRDKSVYRTLFAVDTLRIDGVYTPYPDSKYASFAADRYSSVIMPVWLNLDALSRRVYAESVSLDGLFPLAANKEKMAESIPAISPIEKKNISRIGAFGRRTDPVTGRLNANHEGMDFSTGGKIGIPIYSTGNGRVIFEEMKGGGYGWQIVVDHGFGYKTRYAHLSRILAHPGKEVKRGDLIALSGNTGKSSGPHLHYEVIYRGMPVNPVSYFSLEKEDTGFRESVESAEQTIYE